MREVEPVLRVGRHPRRAVRLARRVEAQEPPVARAPPAAALVGVRGLVRAADAVVARHRGDQRLDVARRVGRECGRVRRRGARPEQPLLRRREQEVVAPGRRQDPAREGGGPAQRIIHRRHARLHVRQRRRRVLPRHRQRLQALLRPAAGVAPPAQLHLRQPQPALGRPLALEPVLAHRHAVQAHRQPVQAQPLPLHPAAHRGRLHVAAPRVLEHHLGVAAVPVHDSLRMPRPQGLRLPVLERHLVAERVRLLVDRPEQRHRRRPRRHTRKPQQAIGRAPGGGGAGRERTAAGAVDRLQRRPRTAAGRRGGAGRHPGLRLADRRPVGDQALRAQHGGRGRDQPGRHRRAMHRRRTAGADVGHAPAAGREVPDAAREPRADRGERHGVGAVVRGGASGRPPPFVTPVP